MRFTAKELAEVAQVDVRWAQGLLYFLAARDAVLGVGTRIRPGTKRVRENVYEGSIVTMGDDVIRVLARLSERKERSP